ncbi:MAG: hypothetical protein JXP36_10820 [Bacteroidales bacterium]|nr:hypothetical protein [Bacteroidales bacterium]
MKPKILKLSSIMLLFLFIGAACQKDEIEYADESVIVSSSPFLSVYKTKTDYFTNISVGINDKVEIISYPDYNIKSANIIIDDEGNITFKYKWRLKSGYEVIEGYHFNSAITDISLKEYVNFNEPYKTNWDINLLQSRVIDYDPFVSYYYLDGLNKRERKFTLGELNEMIENGTLETVFTKLK